MRSLIKNYQLPPKYPFLCASEKENSASSLTDLTIQRIIPCPLPEAAMDVLIWHLRSRSPKESVANLLLRSHWVQAWLPYCMSMRSRKPQLLLASIPTRWASPSRMPMLLLKREDGEKPRDSLWHQWIAKSEIQKPIPYSTSKLHHCMFFLFWNRLFSYMQLKMRVLPVQYAFNPNNVTNRNYK